MFSPFLVEGWRLDSGACRARQKVRRSRHRDVRRREVGVGGHWTEAGPSASKEIASGVPCT
jgi:hypothetical protein